MWQKESQIFCRKCSSKSSRGVEEQEGIRFPTVLVNQRRRCWCIYQQFFHSSGGGVRVARFASRFFLPLAKNSQLHIQKATIHEKQLQRRCKIKALSQPKSVVCHHHACAVGETALKVAHQTAFCIFRSAATHLYYKEFSERTNVD